MKPITKQTVKTASKFVTIGLLIGLLIGAFIAYGQSPSSTFTISSGVYPGAPSYTIWREGSDYFAKDANGRMAYSGTNASYIINSAIISKPIGGDVYLAAGTFLLDSPILIPTHAQFRLHGAGAQVTILSSSLATQNVIQIGDGVTDKVEENCVTVSDLGIASSITKTAGFGILLNKTTYVFIQNFQILNQYVGMYITGSCNQIHISHGSISKCVNETGIGLWIDTTGGDQYVDNVFISSGSATDFPAYGLLVTQSGSAFFSNMDIMHNNIGVGIEPATGEIVAWTTFTAVLADSNTDRNWNIVPDGGFIEGLHLTDCWGSSGRFGMVVANNISALRVDGFRAFCNDRYGVDLYNGTQDSIFTGCVITGNSLETYNIYSGFHVNVGTLHFQISNCRIGYTLASSAQPSQQKYGIEIEASASDYYIVANNDLSHNISGGLFDGGTGGNKTVTGNLS